MLKLPEKVTILIAHLLFGIVIIFYPVLYLSAVVNTLYRKYIRSYKDVIRPGDVAVITGAGHGLGKAYAEILAQKGCNICVVDINEPLAVEVAKELTQKYNIKAKAYKTDVSKFDQIEKLYNQVKEDFGTTTILINNAGVLLQSNYLDIIPSEVTRMIEVNSISNFWTIKLFLPDMKKQKRGRILATASIAGFMPLPYNEAYCSSKHAVRGLMKCLRLNIATEGFDNIKATTVCPYFLTTNAVVEDFCSFFDVAATYPLLDGKTVAQSAIKAMERGDSEIIVPSVFVIMYKLFEFLPSEWHDKVFAFIYRFGGYSHEKMVKFQESLDKSRILNPPLDKK